MTFISFSFGLSLSVLLSPQYGSLTHSLVCLFNKYLTALASSMKVTPEAPNSLRRKYALDSGQGDTATVKKSRRFGNFVSFLTQNGAWSLWAASGDAPGCLSSCLSMGSQWAECSSVCMATLGALCHGKPRFIWSCPRVLRQKSWIPK